VAPGINLRTTTAVDGDDFVFADEGLAYGAQLPFLMLPKPLVDARPAVQVSADSHDRVVRHVQADVAVKLPRLTH